MHARYDGGITTRKRGEAADKWKSHLSLSQWTCSPELATMRYRIEVLSRRLEITTVTFQSGPGALEEVRLRHSRRAQVPAVPTGPARRERARVRTGSQPADRGAPHQHAGLPRLPGDLQMVQPLTGRISSPGGQASRLSKC